MNNLHSEVDIINLIKHTNIVYVINTFSRPFGASAHDALLKRTIRGLSSAGLPGMGGWVGALYWLDLVKSVSHIAGFIYGYYRMAIQNDSSHSTKWWIYSSCASFAGLLGLWMTRLSPSKMIYLIFALAIFYKFFQGYRDSIRPVAYKRLAGHMKGHTSLLKLSDNYKKLSANRKLYTSLAEILGNSAVFLYSLYRPINGFLPLVGLIANLGCVLMIHQMRELFGLRINDVDLSEHQANAFAEKMKGLGFIKNFFGLELARRDEVSYLDVQTSIVKGGARELIAKNKSEAKQKIFNTVLMTSKLAQGYSKNYFLMYGSFYGGLNEKMESGIKLLYSMGSLFFLEIFPKLYRDRYGRHPWSSVTGLISSGIMIMLAVGSLAVTSSTGDGRWSAFIGYPLYAAATNMSIAAFTHLMEIWGSEDKSTDPLTRSYHANMTSMGCGAISRLLSGMTFRGRPTYSLIQTIAILENIYFTRQLRLSAEDGEKI